MHALKCWLFFLYIYISLVDSDLLFILYNVLSYDVMVVNSDSNLI